MKRFQIPTLEEARKKEEESIKKKQSQSPLSKPSSSSFTSTPSSTTTTSTAKTKVKNPYAKTTAAVKNPYLQQKQRSSVKTNQKTPSSSTTIKQQQTRNTPSKNTTPLSSTTAVKRSPLSLLKKSDDDEIPPTSFSQAFGGSNNVPPDDDDDELFDKDTTASVAAENDSISPTKIIQTDNPRDNHINLEHSHVLHISTRQRGNPLLPHIRNVPFTFSKMIPDYILSSSKCILFLSCKYHALHPTYIYRRIAELKNDFTVRILLLLVDLEDNATILAALNHVAVRNDLSLVLCWSNEEAARYIETYKSFESKDASSIQGKKGNTANMDYIDQVTNVLTAVRSVNKTDVHTLLDQFGSVRDIVCSNVEEMSLCPGLGEKKVRRLWEAFRKPFSSLASKKRKRDRMFKEQQQQQQEQRQQEKEEEEALSDEKNHDDDSDKETSGSDQGGREKRQKIEIKEHENEEE